MAHAPGFLKMVEKAKTKIKECTVDDVRRRQSQGEKFFLVDVREDDEWRAGRAKGAVHVGKGVIERPLLAQVMDDPLHRSQPAFARPFDERFRDVQ